jgi:hypothetical protein
MSTTPDWSHFDFADQIKAENSGAEEATTRAIEHMIAVGELLLKAESELMPWLTEHCKLSNETARLYMFMAQHRSKLEAKSQQTGLTVREAIISLPIAPERRWEITSRLVPVGDGPHRSLGFPSGLARVIDARRPASHPGHSGGGRLPVEGAEVAATSK